MTYRVVDAAGVGADWLTKRKRYVCASEAAAVVNLSPYLTQYQLWSQKMSLELTDDDIDLFYFAHALEGPIAARAAQKWPDEFGDGRMKAAPGLLEWTDHPHLAATPDAIVETDDHHPSGVPFQIKTVSPYMTKAWGEVRSQSDVPDGYRIQVILENAIWGSDYGYLAPLFGLNNLAHPIRIDTDLDFLAWFIEQSGEWHARHIIDKEPPELTIGDDPVELWQGLAGGKVAATPELVEMHRQRKLYMLERAAGEDLDAFRKLQIAKHLQDATELIDPETDDLLVTWRPKKSPAVFDLAAFRAAHPGIYAEFTREGKAQRSMLFKDTPTTKADAAAWKAAHIKETPDAV